MNHRDRSLGASIAINYRLLGKSNGAAFKLYSILLSVYFTDLESTSNKDMTGPEPHHVGFFCSEFGHQSMF